MLLSVINQIHGSLTVYFLSVFHWDYLILSYARTMLIRR